MWRHIFAFLAMFDSISAAFGGNTEAALAWLVVLILIDGELLASLQ